MEDFKISLFKNENNASFPEYETLTEIMCQDLTNCLAEKYKLNRDFLENGLTLRQTFYEEINALKEFNLVDTFYKMEIKPPSTIFINWYQFKKIDTFNLKDLSKYFYDIWFPAADDIDLFDESLNWIISIRYDGCISFLKHTDMSF